MRPPGRLLAPLRVDTDCGRTHPLIMKLTLSVDDQVVERARDVARQQGTSLNALVRQYIESLAGQRTGAEVARELKRLWTTHSGPSDGKKLCREDAHERRSK